MHRLIIAVAVLYLCVALVGGIMKIDTKTQRFVDEYGRQRIFHGVNAVYKVHPWAPMVDHFDPQLSLCDEDIQNLKSWGFNAIRLGMMWPGVAPTKDQVNASYIEYMQKLVDKLGTSGLYTILDAHQDVYNRRFCGEGAPDWILDINSDVYTLPFPIPALGTTEYPNQTFPDLNLCLKHIFGTYYFSEACSSAFQCLYDNTRGVQAYFADFWSVVSSKFATSNYVLGYELINEPWLGNIYLDEELIIPGIADASNLAPMYSNLHQAIRGNDNDHIIFYEKSVGNPGPAGFTTGPGGPDYNDRQVYSYHIYCAPTDSNGDPTNVMVCDGEDTLLYDISLIDVKKLGGGGMMTEFGAMANVTNSIENLQYLTGFADDNFQSWTYWQFKTFMDLTTAGPGESFYNAEGQLEINKVKALSRTYVRACAGDLRLMQFDPISCSFETKYTVNSDISQPTEIYLNEDLNYPTGFTVNVQPAGQVKWTKPEKNLIYVVAVNGIVNGTLITVQIGK